MENVRRVKHSILMLSIILKKEWMAGFLFFLLHACIGAVLGFLTVLAGCQVLESYWPPRYHPCGPGFALALLYLGPIGGAIAFVIFSWKVALVLTLLVGVLATSFASETRSD